MGSDTPCQRAKPESINGARQSTGRIEIASKSRGPAARSASSPLQAAGRLESWRDELRDSRAVQGSDRWAKLRSAHERYDVQRSQRNPSVGLLRHWPTRSVISRNGTTDAPKDTAQCGDKAQHGISQQPNSGGFISDGSELV